MASTLIQNSSDPHDIFFTGATNPRDGCIMIGYLGMRAIFFQFETPQIPASETKTTIYRNNRLPVASFEWTMGVHMGMATIGTRQLPMSELVAPGANNDCRKFRASDGRTFEWRKIPNLHGGYDLHLLGPNPALPPLARFLRFPSLRETPVGPSHALLQCSFDDEALLLDALLALCLNRWIDWQGL